MAAATVADAKGNHTFEVRKDKDKNYFAKSSDAEGAYKVAADVGDALDKGLDDFRNKKLFDFGFSDPGKVEVPGAAYDKSGDKDHEPYRIMAHTTLHKNSPISEISAAERQLGKCGELACGFDGSIGAWRRIAKDEYIRTDAEVLALVEEWRSAHPAIRQFWRALIQAARTAIRTGQQVPVGLSVPMVRPLITAAFDGSALTIPLPNGRAINYPGARLVPNTLEEDAAPDIEFMDNARGQWKLVRAWHGSLTENVVQGIARDLLAVGMGEFRQFPAVLHFAMVHKD